MKIFLLFITFLFFTANAHAWLAFGEGKYSGKLMSGEECGFEIVAFELSRSFGEVVKIKDISFGNNNLAGEILVLSKQTPRSRVRPRNVQFRNTSDVSRINEFMSSLTLVVEEEAPTKYNLTELDYGEVINGEIRELRCTLLKKVR